MTTSLISPGSLASSADKYRKKFLSPYTSPGHRAGVWRREVKMKIGNKATKRGVTIGHVYDPDEYSYFFGWCIKRRRKASAVLRAFIAWFNKATDAERVKIVGEK